MVGCYSYFPNRKIKRGFESMRERATERGMDGEIYECMGGKREWGREGKRDIEGRRISDGGIG